MEPEARFDLNRALLVWKKEITAEPGISDEDVRELETHLLASFTHFKQGGLSEEEAFRKAKLQLGSTEGIAVEYAKANPLRVWRHRVFWMAFAGLAISLWSSLTAPLFFRLLQLLGELGIIPRVHTLPVVPFGTTLPVLIVAALIAAGRLRGLLDGVEWCVQSRARLSALGIPLIMVANLTRLCLLHPWSATRLGLIWLVNLPQSLAWPLILFALLLWLFPQRATKVQTESGCEGHLRQMKCVWRERVFWMAIGCLAVGMWRGVCDSTIVTFFYTGHPTNPYAMPSSVIGCLGFFLFLLPAILVSVLALRKRLDPVASGAESWMSSRSRIRLTGCLLLVLWIGFGLLTRFEFNRTVTFPGGSAVSYSWNLNWLWPAGLTALIIWLAPSAKLQGREASA